MRFLGLVTLALLLLLATPGTVSAGDREYRQIYISQGDGNGEAYRSNIRGTYTTLAHKYRRGPSPCGPLGCGGIGPTLRNPDPETARKPENLTSCIYGADGVLVYERENKVCPYVYVDANVQRVEKRRLEYEAAQKALAKKKK